METKQVEKLKAGCRLKNAPDGGVESKNKRFDAESEVFVIKLDKKTGQYTGKYVCCALAPV